MKKTLVLASLLAAFGAASAQSSVTLGGTTGFGYQRDGAARDQSLGEVDFSLTVKGTEQLGGGLAASFSVELDNSNASFRQLNSYAFGSTATTATAQGSDRQGVRRKNTSLVLAGGFGTVTLANTRGSELAVMGLVAPSNLSTDYYSSGVFSRPNIDLLGYSMPLGAVTVGVSYTESGFGEGLTDNSTTATNKTTTLSARYAAGPLTAAAAVKNTTGPSATARKSNVEFGLTYNLGGALVGLGYDSKPITGGTGALAFGVSVPVGNAVVGVNYASRDSATMLEAAAKYNLSARTNVNLSLGRYGSATKVGQYRVSVNHAF